MSPRLPPAPAEVSMRSERSAFAEAVPPGDVTMPCRGPVCVYAYYDDPWKTPVVMAPLRVTGQGEMAADGDVHTQSLTSFGMQDGDDGVPDVYPELGRQVIHDMPRVIVTAELVQDPSAAAEIERLEVEIIEALRGFAADMETALEPWLIEWNRTGWLGTVKVLFKGAKAGWDAWWEGEGELWASIWEWISSLPELAGDAWDSMTAGAKALWENKEKILQILQDMAEGAATAVKTGLEALLTLLENFPDLEEIIGKLRELVRYSAHWMNAMHELAQTQVLNVLASTMLAVLMATTPNFWAELVGKASGFLIPEVLLGILFGILAVFTGGTAGSGLMLRLMAFTRKVQQALSNAGAAGAATAKIFDFLGTIKNKLIDLIQALLRNRTGKGTGEVGEEIPIVRSPPRRSMLSKEKTREILETPKGSRPDPSTYMTRAEIDEHLAQFDDGAVRITSAGAIDEYGTAGPPGGFVMPQSEFDDIINSSGGNFAQIENRLGLDAGSLSSGDMVAVRIDPQDFSGLRIPSGNEIGANPQWLPGGYTSGGAAEAVMDFEDVPFTVVDIGSN